MANGLPEATTTELSAETSVTIPPSFASQNPPPGRDCKSLPALATNSPPDCSFNASRPLHKGGFGMENHPGDSSLTLRMTEKSPSESGRGIQGKRGFPCKSRRRQAGFGLPKKSARLKGFFAVLRMTGTQKDRLIRACLCILWEGSVAGGGHEAIASVLPAVDHGESLILLGV